MKKNKIHYDRKTDILYIVLQNGKEDHAEEVSPHITVEYNKKGKPIGIEVFKAKELLGNKLLSTQAAQTTVSI